MDEHAVLRATQTDHQDLHDEEEVHNMLALPPTIGGKLFHLITFPMVFAFWLTVPDVRNPALTWVDLGESLHGSV